jgi:hypothetical protein
MSGKNEKDPKDQHGGDDEEAVDTPAEPVAGDVGPDDPNPLGGI